MMKIFRFNKSLETCLWVMCQHEYNNIVDLSGISLELRQGLSSSIVIENHEEWLS